jgi:hypothetical protein
MKTRLLIISIDGSSKNRFVVIGALELGFTRFQEHITEANIKTALVENKLAKKKDLILDHKIYRVPRAHIGLFKEIVKAAIEMKQKNIDDMLALRMLKSGEEE